jgi:hypothetical protein
MTFAPKLLRVKGRPSRLLLIRLFQLPAISCGPTRYPVASPGGYLKQPDKHKLTRHTRKRPTLGSSPGIFRAMPAYDLLDQFLSESLRQWARAQ